MNDRACVVRFKGVTLSESDAPLLEKMSKPHRAILQVGTTNYAEMAFMLDLPLGTVRSRLHRARAVLEKLRAANG